MTDLIPRSHVGSRKKAKYSLAIGHVFASLNLPAHRHGLYTRVATLPLEFPSQADVVLNTRLHEKRHVRLQNGSFSA